MVPIGQIPATPVVSTKGTCPYCGVGCGVIIDHQDDTIIGVRGDREHPANFGKLCTKGATLHLSTAPDNRLLFPQLRETRSQSRYRVSWDHALEYAAERFARCINEHGPDSVGFYISGQLLTEDYYVFNKLVKGLIGTNNLDTNSRLCMSSAVAAYKQTLGADAPPCAYVDFDHTTCLLIAGANPAFAHPVAYRRIEEARAANPDMFVIVVDPRRTDTAAGADLHLAISPGSDIWLFNAMLRVMVEEDLVDPLYIAAHTSGFQPLRRHVMSTSIADAAAVCGIPADAIVEAARRFGGAARPLSLWCQGLNQSQHGTHNGTALIALSIATGKIGKPGCGPFSLTGQPNAMGGREVGGLSNLLSAHRDMASADDRDAVARLWGVASVPAVPGLSAVEMFEAAADGKLKALWVCCTNPAFSMPDHARIKAALERCEFVVLQEAFATTETAAFADLLLPASTWCEKDGCVTNSERRVTHVGKAVRAPGEARADWRIAADFALLLGPKIGTDALPLFDYATAAEVFDEHVASTRGRDLDITALSHQVLDALGPQQWPIRAGETTGQIRLYSDGHFATPDGRARFIVPSTALSVETPSHEWPMRLLTGRVRDQWHGMSRTGNIAQLMNHAREPHIDMTSDDMRQRGLEDGDLAEIAGARGTLILPVLASDQMQAGQAFVAMHWGRKTLNSAGSNVLMPSAFDPYSKQPELKHATVSIKAADLSYHLILMRTERDALMATKLAQERLKQVSVLLESVGFGSLTLAGREAPTLVVRIAHRHPIDAQLHAELEHIMGFEPQGGLRYRDQTRSIDKRAVIEDNLLLGIKLAGETCAAAWIRELMVERIAVNGLRRSLFAPLKAAPVNAGSRGVVVCNCLNVSSSQIDAVLQQGSDLKMLQERLGCGTSCGSCLPELRLRIARSQQPAMPLLAA